MRPLALIGLTLALTSVADTQVASEKPTPPLKTLPAWIWLDDNPRDNQTVYFRKEFAVASPVVKATLQATCDNALTLFVDGKEVLQHGEWEAPALKDVTEAFQKSADGKHVIAVIGH